MSDKFAGLWRQVQDLKHRLKELDTSDADPTEISAVADALEKLETRLEKQKELKKQRREEKEKVIQEQKQKEIDFLKGTESPKEEVKMDDQSKTEVPEVEEVSTDTTVQTDLPATYTIEPNPGNTTVNVEAPQETPAEVPAAAAEDKIPGGLADKKKDEDFDPKQLAEGIIVELEHTDNFDTAKEIAKDHLTEDPEYYIKLKKYVEPKNTEDLENKPMDPEERLKVWEEVNKPKTEEKEATKNIFALDSIVEPVRGTPGSWGRVMRHDSPDADVFVIWEEGKLKEEHVAGAYNPSDLRTKVEKEAMDPEERLKVWEEVNKAKEKKEKSEAFEKEKEERKKREEEYQKKKKEMGLSSHKLSKRHKTAQLVRDPNLELKPGTKFYLERSIMAKEGLIIPAGTEGEVKKVVDDHLYISTKDASYLINKFDAKKLFVIASLKKKAVYYQTSPETWHRIQHEEVNPELKEKVRDPEHCYYCAHPEEWEKLHPKKKLHHVEQTQPEMGDVNENPGIGYGGDRPGVHVEPKATKKVASVEDDSARIKNYLTEVIDWKEDFNPEEPLSYFFGVIEDLVRSPFDTNKFLGDYPVENEAQARKVLQILTNPNILNQYVDVSELEEYKKEAGDEDTIRHRYDQLIDHGLNKARAIFEIAHELNLPYKIVRRVVDDYTKSSSLKVAQKEWFAVRHDNGYLVTDENDNRVCLIKAKQELSKEQIENIVYNELLKREMLTYEAKIKDLPIKKEARIVKEKGKWCVKAESGRNMGCYDTKEEAEKRLKQVEMFKHMKGKKLSRRAIEIPPETLTKFNECPECYLKFLKFAKEKGNKVTVNGKDLDIEDQIQKTLDQIKTTKEKLQTQSEVIQEINPGDMVHIMEGDKMTAEAVEVLFIKEGIALVRFSSGEEKQVPVSKLIPSPVHESSVEKETQYRTPKPATPPPAGFIYAYDPDSGEWILVAAE